MGWRQWGLAAILSTSVVFADVYSVLGASCRDAGGLVVTFGMGASFMCILFLLTTPFDNLTMNEQGSQLWIGSLQEWAIFLSGVL